MLLRKFEASTGDVVMADVVTLPHVDGIKEQLTEKYNECISMIRFERISRVMKALDWKWMGSPHTPTIEEMKACCDQLFVSALEHLQPDRDNTITCSTGGFRIMIDPKHMWVRVSFETDYWQAG